MSLYIARLTDGNCITVLAASEGEARERAGTMIFDAGIGIASLRELENFTAYLTLTDEGAISLALWDCFTDNEILQTEYPILHDAHLRASAELFAQGVAAGRAGTVHRLDEARRKNADAIREAVRHERRRMRPGKEARLRPVPSPRVTATEARLA